VPEARCQPGGERPRVLPVVDGPCGRRVPRRAVAAHPERADQARRHLHTIVAGDVARAPWDVRCRPLPRDRVGAARAAATTLRQEGRRHRARTRLAAQQVAPGREAAAPPRRVGERAIPARDDRRRQGAPGPLPGALRPRRHLHPQRRRARGIATARDHQDARPATGSLRTVRRPPGAGEGRARADRGVQATATRGGPPARDRGAVVVRARVRRRAAAPRRRRRTSHVPRRGRAGADARAVRPLLRLRVAVGDRGHVARAARSALGRLLHGHELDPRERGRGRRRRPDVRGGRRRRAARGAVAPRGR
jgi:hypothetical protein